MYKEIKANGKGSYTDFGLAIKERTISLPSKKTVKEEIPFRNGSYDFSNINGEIYWEERELEYTFDIAEFSTEEMEQIKSKIVDWLLNIHDTDIEDDYSNDYYYHGSYDDNSWSEDFGQGELSITFLVYPYKFAKTETVKTIIATTEEQTITIQNDSSHRIIPEITTTGLINIIIGSNTYALNTGTHNDSKYLLEKGSNIWKIKADNDTATVNITFRKEVF